MFTRGWDLRPPDQGDRLQTSRRWAGRSQDLPKLGHSPQVRHWLSSAHQALNARPEAMRNFTALWSKAL